MMKLKSLIPLMIMGLLGAAYAVAGEVYQDGPNCYNTSLQSLGYTQDVAYNSDEELSFFTENFCNPVSPTHKVLNSRDLILFVDRESKSVIHTAVALDKNKIIEKYSLLGSLNEPREDDPQPGRQITHALAESIYSPALAQGIFGQTYQQQIYSCKKSDEVQKTLSRLSLNPAIAEQLKFRKFLVENIKIADRKILEQNIMNHLVPQVLTMKWDSLIQKTPQSSLEKTYLLGLLRSNAYQFRLLICSQSLKMGDECHAPQIQKAVDVNNAWFEKINSIN